MLNEFYDFIAKKINSYFQTAASEGTLLKGESFCLKLDNDDMVIKVTEALKDLATSNQSIGKYEYLCGDESIYKTYTLKVIDDEVIIASQINGMTNDFLCATLRNAANNEQKPLLMISSNPIDSAKSGSRDMSSSGMPFYADQLMFEIRNMVNESTQLTNTEKRILQFELKRRDADVFSDKASIYEYRDLLAIMSSGKIDTNNFPGFRLFSVDGKKEYLHYGNNQVDKELKNNNELFEKIDRGIRFGNLEIELAKVFEDNVIVRIEKAHKDEVENWSRLFTYAELLAAMERKQAKMENPLKIENDDIEVYGDLPFNTINFDDGFLIRNEGSQTAKKRTKNLLIFNPEHYANMHIQVSCNAKIINSGIMADDSKYVKAGKNIIFLFDREGMTFHKIEIKDEANDITYIFKICIIDISPEFMYSTVKHSFSIDYKKTKKNSRIKLAGVGINLIFNKNGVEVSSCKLEDNEIYSCGYGERLLIYSSEEEISNFGSGIKIDVNFSGVLVPFILFPDEVKSVEIIGRKILRDKLSNKKSFEFDDGAILSDSQEYFAKANLLRELRLEQDIIDNSILCGNVKNFYVSDSIKIDSRDLTISSTLKDAFLSMLSAFKLHRTIPTLAYLGGDLQDSVKNFIKAFEECFENLSDGENLSQEQEYALYLGTLSVGKNSEEILLTPFHPLNLKYQLTLLNESGLEYATDIVMDRLNSINLLPYIQRMRKIYKVSDQLYSQEWKYYAPVENKKYRGSRRYVPKLIEEKISEFISHFRYIFDDINNKKIRVNLINIGDCSEVFIGLAQFFIHSINRNADAERLAKFELHIYTDDITGNAFSNLKEYSLLKEYLAEQKLFVINGTSMNSLEGILSKNIECYFHKDNGKNYNYAHISFYEMESEIISEQATMNQIETGISLGGILSGIPSSKYGYKYRTGYGVRYAEDTSLTRLSSLYNALMQVETTGNPYHSGTSISTQIDELVENKMDYIYKNSNWVVFVDPKVDLDFFSEKEANSDLLIIHYSDQYTSSSGYDAITVTHKSQQYSLVIQEYLKTKGVSAEVEDVHKIINLFNAVNGDWLLRLVSSKKGNKDSTFSREKISIVATIKFMLAFLKHKDIVWIPISLEEMLRISGGAGLSQDEGILSAKNLGFEKGPTSDDLLFIGLDRSGDVPKVYLYPTEVKTGNNDNAVIKKAFEQASSTASGLHNAFNPGGEMINTILYKVNRNFLMQMLVTSCKKMQVYHVDDTQNWDIVLDTFREALLNEKYVLSEDIQELIGKGAVLSFRKALVSRRTSFKEDAINFIEMPEIDEFGLILKDVYEIYEDIRNKKNTELLILDDCVVDKLTGDLSKLSITKLEDRPDDSGDGDKIEPDPVKILESKREEPDKPEVVVPQPDSTTEDVEDEERCMHILFGTNAQDGKPVIWKPNDTTQLFHTNTGIIGTMGTGKTQFTKSLIAQLYRDQDHNVDGQKLGILIFDYKGDYNESKTDFVTTTNATILKPYHLPFNPLALTKSSVFKPLLPIHTANAFKDTISKVYGLGPKQQDTLFQCIIETYQASGITPSNATTWDNETPTFDQVYQRYANDEEIKKNDSLAAAMNKLHQFEVFEANPSNTKSLFDILQGVVVIDLSGYDSDIQSLIVAITLDLFYTQMQASGSSKMLENYRQLTKIILVDEADNFMSEGFSALKKILKEGREFGVGTILSTQFLKHFGSGEDDYAKYILTWVVHNVSDLKNSDVDFVFKTETKSQENQVLYNSIKGLTKHHSIVKIGNNKPVYVQDKAFWELYKELH
ncbi:DUF87 domain-containing protein [Anaerocolumna sp. AGMB13025]|uniref:helicase HerA domain-containing protein n=1 Tax=Anaerocolumna sp. AGMB13025 TaxID=3039116 RepID=UPI00241FBCD3|nr:DUF87 domain-containing protein [Anaerocolumna sp. AGMB13025]WFR58131.1 DUF87 domain-containing protein [Anaerocolumna sp. AGMB13025]